VIRISTENLMIFNSTGYT